MNILKKTLILSALLLSFLHSRAQNTFNIPFNYQDYGEFTKGVYQKDSSYFLIGITTNFSVPFVGLDLITVNTDGTQTSQIVSIDSSLNYFTEFNSSLHLLNDSILYSSGAYFNSLTGDADVIMIYYNLNSKLFGVVPYPDNSYEGSYNSYRTLDNGFLIIGVRCNTASSICNFLIQKLDSAGNLLWKNIYSASNYDIGLKVFEQSNKNIIASGIANLTASNESTWILKLDSNGNIINQKFYGSIPYNCGDGHFTFLTSDYLMTGCLDTVYEITDYSYPGYIAKLDSDFNIVWRTDFHSEFFKAIIEMKQLPDSSIIFCGEQFIYGWVGKLDKNGFLLWEHAYQYSNSNFNTLADIIETSDGGYAATGSTIGSVGIGAQDAWLLKLDSNGCLIPGCVTNIGTIEIENTGYDLQFFPNPASTQTTILFHLPHLVKQAALIVYSITGEKITTLTLESTQHTITLDVSDWASGMFFCQLIADGKPVISEKLIVAR